ncbi:hypothetical protein KJ780_02330 [Candidatus Micrarchaeota archaeon]|nr:hypothetical protein [Candidatus Micrarchaeota archaeon]
MIALVQKQKTHQEAEPIPLVLKFDEVRKQFNPVFIPDELIMELVKTGDPEKVNEITNTAEKLIHALVRDANYFGERWPIAKLLAHLKLAKLFIKDSEILIDAFSRIAKATGNQAEDTFKQLCYPEISELFAKYTKEFAQIAETTGPYSRETFSLFSNPEIAALFMKDQQIVIDSFAAIISAAGENSKKAFSVIGYSWELGNLFAKYTKEFVQIAEATGPSAYTAFDSLQNKDISNLFVKNPKLVVDAFGGIARSAGNGAADAFRSVFHLSNLFTKYTKEFVQIAEATGPSAYTAFDSLQTKEIADLFIKNPELLIDSFSRIAQAAGDGANAAFQVLSNSEVGEILVEYTDEFVQIAQAARENTANAFKAVSSLQIKLLRRNSQLILDAFREIGTTVMLSGENARDITAVIRFNENHPDEFKTLWHQCGIRYFSRYSEELLMETALNIHDLERKKDAPSAVLFFNQADYNGAFYQDAYAMDDIIKNGYRVILYEVNNEQHFFDKILESGSQKQIDLLVIAGHGDSEGVRLGQNFLEGTNYLDTGDVNNLRALVPYLENDCAVVFISCSTGKEKKDAKPADWKSIAGAFSKVALEDGICIRVFAPSCPTYYSGLRMEFGSGLFCDISYQIADTMRFILDPFNM